MFAIFGCFRRRFRPSLGLQSVGFSSFGVCHLLRLFFHPVRLLFELFHHLCMTLLLGGHPATLHEGAITHAAVAFALDKPHVPVSKVLR